MFHKHRAGTFLVVAALCALGGGGFLAYNSTRFRSAGSTTASSQRQITILSMDQAMELLQAQDDSASDSTQKDATERTASTETDLPVLRAHKGRALQIFGDPLGDLVSAFNRLTELLGLVIIPASEILHWTQQILGVGTVRQQDNCAAFQPGTRATMMETIRQCTRERILTSYTNREIPDCWRRRLIPGLRCTSRDAYFAMTYHERTDYWESVRFRDYDHRHRYEPTAETVNSFNQGSIRVADEIAEYVADTVARKFGIRMVQVLGYSPEYPVPRDYEFDHGPDGHCVVHLFCSQLVKNGYMHSGDTSGRCLHRVTVGGGHKICVVWEYWRTARCYTCNSIFQPFVYDCWDGSGRKMRDIPLG